MPSSVLRRQSTSLDRSKTSSRPKRCLGNVAHSEQTCLDADHAFQGPAEPQQDVSVAFKNHFSVDGCAYIVAYDPLPPIVLCDKTPIDTRSLADPSSLLVSMPS